MMQKKWIGAALGFVLLFTLLPSLTLHTAGQVGPPVGGDGDGDGDESSQEDNEIPAGNIQVNGYNITVYGVHADDFVSVVYAGRTLRQNTDYVLGSGTEMVQITLRGSFADRLPRGRHRIFLYFNDGVYARAYFTTGGYVYTPPQFPYGGSEPLDTRSDEERVPITEDYSGMPREWIPPAAENINRNPGTGR